jgi:hypothetical protein
MFTLHTDHIIRLALLNFFRIPDDQMYFFGLRGCLPVSDDSLDFGKEHHVEITPFDHIHPSCTLGQYHPEKGIALFPGSTVPHRRNIGISLDRGGMGTNMLLTGFYRDYRKGWHKPGSDTGHEAFRQDNKLPVRRTADDLDYDNDDRVEYTRPYDNLHAAWSMGPDHDYFGSAGCQVVAGYPKCSRRQDNPDAGPWKVFRENAYSIPQNSFDYILLNGRDAYRVSYSPDNQLTVRLRFGSYCDLVGTVQEKLKKLNYYEGEIDNDFGPRTLRAVLEFQTDFFGEEADDGIVGPVTASGLDIELPRG